jgi:predicted amidohydrolase
VLIVGDTAVFLVVSRSAANSVGPQRDDLWSAGDSKMVAPDMTMVALANNRDEMLIQAEIDLSKSGRK